MQGWQSVPMAQAIDEGHVVGQLGGIDRIVHLRRENIGALVAQTARVLKLNHRQQFYGINPKRLEVVQPG